MKDTALYRLFAFAACLLPLPCLSLACSAQSVDFEAVGTQVRPEPADPQIAAALRQVSPERIQANITHLVAFYNRSTLSSTETDLKPNTGVLAAADWIKAQFEAYSKDCGGCLEVHFDEFVEQPPKTGFGGGQPRIVKPTPLRNVYAILRGADPVAAKRMYLVTGHYDTRNSSNFNTHDEAPGANDDSSGTAVSMESARVLSKLRFPATLVFVAVAGEEQGLYGSHHLAMLAKQQGWQLEGVLNNDIVGGDTTPGETLQNKSRVRVFSQGILPTAPPDQIRQMLSLGMENDSPSRQLAREVLHVNRMYFAAPRLHIGTPIQPGGRAPKQSQFAPALLPVMELRLDRFLRGGDHKSFSDEGFASVRFTEWRENFNHQHQNVRTENGTEFGDLLKFDDFDYIARVAQLNMATLATLASSPGEPQDVRVVTTDLDNDTTLRWSAPKAPGTGAVQYQIVWRETSANDWQYSAEATRFLAKQGVNHPPGSGFAATLPVSKDNVFFGVRACDGAGHCGAAVAPVPERENR